MNEPFTNRRIIMLVPTPKVRVSELRYGFKKLPGSAYKLKSTDTGIEAVITAHGGRVMGLRVPIGPEKQQELMCTYPDRFANIWNVFKMDPLKVTWDDVLTGGGRLEIGPEGAWKGHFPFLDTNLVLYKTSILDRGLILKSPVGLTGMQLFREITMEANGALKIAEWVENHGRQMMPASPWDVFQILRPDSTTIETLSGPPRPYINSDIGHPPQGVIEELLGPSGIYRLNYGIPAKMFKLGFHHVNGANGIGIMTSFFSTPLGQTIRLEEKFPAGEGKCYPHMGTSEIFKNNSYDPNDGIDHSKRPEYIEQEVHGPQSYLDPGESSEVLQLSFGVELL
jgi:hypothetical protein